MTSEADRWWHAMRACERMVSGTRPLTMRERLAALLDCGQGLDTRGDTYGDGPVAAVEERVAGLLGKPAAVFFPTGTMAQQVALRGWAQRSGNPTVATHPLHHVEVHERKAFSILSGLHSVWPTRDHRQPTAPDLATLGEPFGTLLVELPLRDAGYLLPTWDELVALTEVARERGAKVHVDGARLWETTLYFGHDLPAIAGLADSVYVSFYKTLGGISGAALAGPEDFIAPARAWRHRYGGNLVAHWPAALAAQAGLDAELPRLESYVAHARVVAAALAKLPGATVFPGPPHTHQFQLWLPGPAEALTEAALRLAEQERVWFAGPWRDVEPTGLAMTEVTVAAPALELTTTDVGAIGEAFVTLARTQALASGF